MNSKILEYIARNSKWEKELSLIRSILLELPLEEDLKWGIPAYIYKKKNILGLAAFKNYCGIWFHHGVFLKDESNLLVNAQKDKTKGMRQMRFNTLEEIDVDLVKMYVLEAISNSEAGKEIKPQKNTKPILIPEELELLFSKNEKLKYLFNEFSISKQREFCEYILSAKRMETKEKRLQKIILMILEKKGLYDKYKNC